MSPPTHSLTQRYFNFTIIRMYSKKSNEKINVKNIKNEYKTLCNTLVGLAIIK